MPENRHDRDYLVRSQKRPDSHSRARKGRRVTRVLNVISVILSVLVWPIGMIVLWLRRNRMYVSTKLLVSMITLILCVLLYGFLLNQPFGNEKVDAIQKQANEALDRMYDGALAAIDTTVDRVSDGAAAFREVSNASAVLISRAGGPAVEKLCDAGETAHVWISQAAQDVSAFAVRTWDSVFGSKDDPAVLPDVTPSSPPEGVFENGAAATARPSAPDEGGAETPSPTVEPTRYIYRYTSSPAPEE